LDQPTNHDTNQDSKSARNASEAGINRIRNRRQNQPTKAYIDAIRSGNRTMLSKAITLAESAKPQDQKKAQAIIEGCMENRASSIRIGITGIPGVGKSTFIEALGGYLLEQRDKLAVLAIDPTSSRTKGSILGDKTRMETLANRDDVYIRPSPTSGSLGGVARKTRETILLCEAAGFDTIIIETVGVGQSEIAVHSMVDFFLLLMIAGAGDELQGIKRGIVEMADAIAINKADGDNITKAQRAAAEYKRALHLYPPQQSGWLPQVNVCSALTGKGIANIWSTIEDYMGLTRKNGYFHKNRQSQAVHWMYETIEEHLKNQFYNNENIKSHLADAEQKVRKGQITSYKAASELLNLVKRNSTK